MHDPLSDALEALVDKHGLQTVLEHLSPICRAKADHIRTHWLGGQAQARCFDLAADRLDRIIAKIDGC